MAFKKTTSKGRKSAPSSSRGADTAASTADVVRTPSAQEDVPLVRSHNLRSSGKRPLTVEEADRYEALARKRSSSRVKPSNPEPIVIFDDEGDDQTKPTPAWSPEPECKPGFPDLASIGGYGWKPPIDLDGPLPRIQPLTEIAPGGRSTIPDASTVIGVLQ